MLRIAFSYAAYAVAVRIICAGTVKDFLAIFNGIASILHPLHILIPSLMASHSQPLPCQP